MKTNVKKRKINGKVDQATVNTTLELSFLKKKVSYNIFLSDHLM